MSATIYRDTNLLRVRIENPTVLEEVRRALRYQRVEYDHTARRRRAQRAVKLRWVYCYEETEVNGEQQLLVPVGFAPLVEEVLQRHQQRARRVEYRVHPRPEVFTPNWDVLADYELRPRQREILESLVKNERGWIQFPTGSGKSFLISVLCRMLPRARFAVTTYARTVLLDRYRELRAMMPSVGVSCSGEKKVLGQRVMCATAGTLVNAVDPATVDVVIADEAHELGTDRYLAAFSRFRWARMFAFSANKLVDRQDGAGFELQGVFGTTLLQMDYDDGVRMGVIVPIEVRLREVRMQENPCEGLVDDVARMRHAIWRNKHRNRMIAEDARRYPEDQVLITVATLDHACELKRLLPEYTLCYAPTTANQQAVDEYVGRGFLSQKEPRLTKSLMIRYKRNFQEGRLRKVIATTVWNRGVNFHQLAVLIRADATSSAANDTQIPGRLSRLSSGKEVGVLHDYLDTFDDSFWRRSELRLTHYRRHKWKIILPPGYISRRQSKDPRHRE